MLFVSGLKISAFPTNCALMFVESAEIRFFPGDKAAARVTNPEDAGAPSSIRTWKHVLPSSGQGCSHRTLTAE